MLKRLKYNEKPDDPKLTIKQSIDPWNKQTDIVWMYQEDWIYELIEKRMSDDLYNLGADLVNFWEMVFLIIFFKRFFTCLIDSEEYNMQ